MEGGWVGVGVEVESRVAAGTVVHDWSRGERWYKRL